MDDLHQKLVPKLLFVIVDRDRADDVAEFIDDAPVHLHYRCRGDGTASSEMLDMLGLGRTAKCINICLGPRQVIETLLRDISTGMRLRKRGRGIAFTVPISGISNPIFKLMDEEMRKMWKSQLDSEVENVKATTHYELIIAVINRGYSEDLMDAAREAGAAGGTVVHARSMGNHERIQHYGISVQEEKELVYIIARKENHVAIMRAIGKACGLNTKAEGFVLSLPVDGIEGIAAELHADA